MGALAKDYAINSALDIIILFITIIILSIDID